MKIPTFRRKYIHAYNAAATSPMVGGLAISEDIETVEDREVNFVISRDHEGCDIAFNQIPTVYAAVMDKVCAYNSGVIVNSTDMEKYSDDIKYLENRRDELELERHLTTCLANRELYGVGANGIKLQNGELKYIVDINTKEESDDGTYSFKLIVNSLTGKLGQTELDPENPLKEIVAIQKGEILYYNSNGNVERQETDKRVYFGNEDIMVLGNYELGRIRGQSSVMRILKYAEAVVRLENTVLLLSRRPTQLIYTAGNESHNLLNCEIPQSYITAAEGDRVQARINYKVARLTALNTEAKKLADGRVLAQVLEYGTDMKAIEVPEGLPYQDYIQWFAQQIRMGITGEQKIDRRVVRSREQEAKLRAELLNRTKLEQRQIRAWLNNNLTKKLLEGRTATIDEVWYDFDTTYTEDKDKTSRIWMNMSQAVRNFAQAGVNIPEKLKELLEVDEEWDIKEDIKEKNGSEYTSKGG